METISSAFNPSTDLRAKTKAKIAGDLPARPYVVAMGGTFSTPQPVWEVKVLHLKRTGILAIMQFQNNQTSQKRVSPPARLEGSQQCICT